MSIYKFFEEPFVWPENATWPGDEWSINVFSGVQKWQISFGYVRYDSIFNETAGGCNTCKMILKIIASCGNELKFDSVLGFFCCSCFVTWCDIFIGERNMGHALWMALMSYEWHDKNYFRKIAVMEYLSTKWLVQIRNYSRVKCKVKTQIAK